MSAQLIEDYNLRLNARSARWVEEQVWVYRTDIIAPEEAVSNYAWLVFDGLDLDAVIYLNGEEIGRHWNAFTPARFAVSGKVRAGKNSLAVRLESGLYSVSDKPGGEYCVWMDHKLHKRVWLRKPQYQFSWDWSPSLVNAGIWRGVRLERAECARIDSVSVYSEVAPDNQSAVLHTLIFSENTSGEKLTAVLRMHVVETGDSIETTADLASGCSDCSLAVPIENPKLWGPRSYGGQYLYTAKLELVVDGVVVDSAVRRTGIRSVRTNSSSSGAIFWMYNGPVPRLDNYRLLLAPKACIPPR